MPNDDMSVMAEDYDSFGFPTAVPAASALPSESCRIDLLKREADGLFAGVALLNELEPLCDLDEGIGGSASTLVDCFLSRLRPEPSGRGIRCTKGLYDSYPMTTCGDIFPCTSRGIQAHFRNCTFIECIEDQTRFLEDLEVALERPASKNLLASLQQRCQNIQERLSSLPEIDDYLCRLERLQGNFVNCTFQGCSFPSKIGIQDIVGHYWLYHCPNFEGSLEFEPSLKTHALIEKMCKRPFTAYLISSISNPKYEGIPKRRPFCNPKPTWDQLGVLRTLRAKFIVNHRTFLQRTTNSSSEILKRLRKSCKDPSKLLDTGILTLQEIMNDKSPLSLKEVFSFISLSFAMTETMQARGHITNLALSKADFTVCKNSLGNEEDRIALEELISLMWQTDNEKPLSPEDIPPYLSPVGQYIWEFIHEATVISHGSLRSTAERLLEESVANEDFCFGDWLNFPEDDWISRKGNLDLVNLSHEASWIGSLEIPPDLNFGDSNAANPPEIQPPLLEENQNVLMQLQGLMYTALFMQCTSFLVFIGGMGTLLQQLSGTNQDCFTADRGISAGESIAGFSRFLEISKFRVLNVLCLDPELSKYRALFNVAAKLLEAGWLRTVQNIEKYLIHIIKLFADCRSSYLAVVSKILNCSMNAARDDRMDDEYRYGQDRPDVELYNPDYIARRQEEEATACGEDTMVSVCTTYGPVAGSNAQPNVDMSDSLDKGHVLGSNYGHQRISETTSPTCPSRVNTSSTDSGLSQGTPLSREPMRRKCDVEGCGKVYTGVYCTDALARHKREKHTNRSFFTCSAQSCGHESKRLHNLRVHWETKHKSMPMPEWLIGGSSCGESAKRKREHSMTD